jgi:large subunit ribosomal protein L21e
MVKKSRGFRSGTRHKLMQAPSKRATINKFLQTFKKDDNVIIYHEPSSHKGMPFPMFKGRTGKVTGTRGKSYLVQLNDGGKTKMIISRPEHLRKL